MNYKIEGGIDFYAELNKPITVSGVCADTCANTDAGKEDEDTNKCLITRMPLLADSVQLDCGHSFNYLPLFNDLVQQVKPSINGWSRVGRIGCPFCRRFQQTILPFNPAYKLVVGVNLYPLKLCSSPPSVMLCRHEEPCCLNTYTMCPCVHITTNNTYKLDNGMHYCEGHVRIGVSIVKQEAVRQAFLTRKAQMDIILADKKAKLEKKKKKIGAVGDGTTTGTTKPVGDGTTTGTTTWTTTGTTTIGCIRLLKSGPNKGHMCGCQKVDKETGVCSRHKDK